ncbi:MAG: RIP metalloprotease RseP [Opitutales bacterium]
MSLDLLQGLLANVWSIFLVVLFFGGSIFVHELGHFLAARRRGVHVERFSIGFGPAIFSWRGRDGIEYRVAWLPLGGYVLLPQLADLRGVEGESAVNVDRLPPVSYGTKMLVFVAGATCNILFALALACVVWSVGQPTNSQIATTRIGYVSPTLPLPDGSIVPSPASRAGLEVGDVIVAIDGTKVNDWMDVLQAIVTGSGRGANDQPKAVFTIARAGQVRQVTVYPRLSGDEKFRRVGIDSGYELKVLSVNPRSPAAQAGFKPGDELLTLNGKSAINANTYEDIVTQAGGAPIAAVVRRADKELTLTLPAQHNVKADATLGLALTTGFKLTHPSPFAQVYDNAVMTFRTLFSLINPRSDIGLSKVAGPVGIVRIFHSAAEAGLQAVLMFTILVNVNLAIFNLLPIPVLDGGQMLFATIGKLRGRALPVNFIMATQSAFVVLLFSMILYVSFFDVRRIVRDNRPEPPAAAAAPARP